MSEATTTALRQLEFDVADRMRKGLRVADVSVGDMADYLGVSRNTVGRYINGHTSPDRRTLRLWALRCGVPFDWLTTGEIGGGEGTEPGPAPDDGSGVVSVNQWFTTPTVSTAEILTLRKRIGYPGAAQPDRRSPRTARYVPDSVSA